MLFHARSSASRPRCRDADAKQQQRQQRQQEGVAQRRHYSMPYYMKIANRRKGLSSHLMPKDAQQSAGVAAWTRKFAQQKREDGPWLRSCNILNFIVTCIAIYHVLGWLYDG